MFANGSTAIDFSSTFLAWARRSRRGVTRSSANRDRSRTGTASPDPSRGTVGQCARKPAGVPVRRRQIGGSSLSTALIDVHRRAGERAPARQPARRARRPRAKMSARGSTGLAADLLGRHVADVPTPCPRWCRAAVGRVAQLDDAARSRRLARPKSRIFSAVGGEEHVGRLQIAVDDAACVGRGQPRHQLQPISIPAQRAAGRGRAARAAYRPRAAP